MPSWSNKDVNTAAPAWATTEVFLRPTSANVTEMFGNTTQNNWVVQYGNTSYFPAGPVQGIGNTRSIYNAEGLFLVDQNMAAYARANNAAHIAGVGWNIQTVGSGGRAGRVQNECLVALSSILDANGNTSGAIALSSYGNTVVLITTQPANNSATHGVGAGNNLTFTVIANTSNPNFNKYGSANLSYAWQFANTANANDHNTFWSTTSNITNSPYTANTVFTGNASSSLIANTYTTTANQWIVRAIVIPPAGTYSANLVSANALVTVL